MRCPALFGALLLAAASSIAGAQSIYRCGNAYSERPCSDASEIDRRDDERSDAQREQALEAQQRHREMAEQLARERREFEAQPVAAGGIHGVQKTQEEEAPVAKPRSKRSARHKHRTQDRAAPAGLKHAAP
ncbi:hypothetical protein M8A51_04055 [Schlegelella sp. S2-27]|uniref:DUF4124 domain-containing protein n=1 Tax=Caldimonas mangrovi TaxID=2944811 RepID=A0ABT0YJ67_9BURK|nr:hypothetical protein [Caldimonas mangrovi]MCM5678703.1 hypothetical protein [Caldimonas mangrovi]